MSLLAHVLLVALGTAPGRSAPASTLPVVLDEKTFLLRLPKGWHTKLVELSGDSPSEVESRTKTYEGPDGRSLALELDGDAHGFCADAIWKVKTTGDRIEIIEEGCLAPPPEAGAEPDEEGCIADETVGIATRFDVKGHSYLVIFWTDRQRTRTDLPVFRAILRSFRAK